MCSISNVLTIDVEEYFQVHGFETVIHRSDWDRFPCRVVPNTQRILRLLAEYDVHATFFILGWIADRYPELVEEIAAGGHEIATHGYWHELIYRQQPADFAADLQKSLRAIKRVLNGTPVIGYRAPAFSITDRSLWALDILCEHGIQYDSSIFPVSAHDRYGINGAHRFASKVRSGLWEFPVSTMQVGKYRLPVAGGGYFRLYPLWLTRRAIRRINAQGHPAIIYLHPWEFDPDQPRVSDAPWLSRFRHYVNLDKTESRIRVLLQEFPFGTMHTAFTDCLERQR